MLKGYPCFQATASIVLTQYMVKSDDKFVGAAQFLVAG